MFYAYDMPSRALNTCFQYINSSSNHNHGICRIVDREKIPDDKLGKVGEKGIILIQYVFYRKCIGMPSDAFYSTEKKLEYYKKGFDAHSTFNQIEYIENRGKMYTWNMIMPKKCKKFNC